MPQRSCRLWFDGEWLQHGHLAAFHNPARPTPPPSALRHCKVQYSRRRGPHKRGDSHTAQPTAAAAAAAAHSRPSKAA